MSERGFQCGQRVRCLNDDWHNAFGDRHEVMRRGMSGVVVDSRRVAGVPCLELEEFPGQWFWTQGFRPERLDG